MLNKNHETFITIYIEYKVVTINSGLLNILSGKDSSTYKIFMKSLAVIKGNAYENESFYNFFIKWYMHGIYVTKYIKRC